MSETEVFCALEAADDVAVSVAARLVSERRKGTSASAPAHNNSLIAIGIFMVGDGAWEMVCGSSKCVENRQLLNAL